MDAPSPCDMFDKEGAKTKEICILHNPAPQGTRAVKVENKHQTVTSG